MSATRTRVSDATAVTFSVKCFNPLKLYPLSGNIFRKWFAAYPIIYSRTFNNHVISISNGEFFAATTLIVTYIVASKNI